MKSDPIEPQSPVLAIPVLTYATPIDLEAGGVWCDGKLLVIRRGNWLPERCLRCGRPSDGKPKSKTLYWHHPAIYIFLLFCQFGFLIYIVVAICARKKVRVNIPLCVVHRSRRMRVLLVAWLTGLTGLAASIIAVRFIDDRKFGVVAIWGVIIGIVVVLAAMVFDHMAGRTLIAKRITRELAWIKGASPAFLADLPSIGPR